MFDNSDLFSINNLTKQWNEAWDKKKFDGVGDTLATLINKAFAENPTTQSADQQTLLKTFFEAKKIVDIHDNLSILGLKQHEKLQAAWKRIPNDFFNKLDESKKDRPVDDLQAWFASETDSVASSSDSVITSGIFSRPLSPIEEQRASEILASMKQKVSWINSPPRQGSESGVSSPSIDPSSSERLERYAKILVVLATATKIEQLPEVLLLTHSVAENIHQITPGEQINAGSEADIKRLRIGEKDFVIRIPKSGNLDTASLISLAIPPHEALVAPLAVDPEGRMIFEEAESDFSETMVERREKVLKSQEILSSPLLQKELSTIASAINHLHQHGYIHNDIKGANILVFPNGKVAVADFGLCRPIEEMKSNPTFLGTPAYAAPEMITRRLSQDPELLKKVDVWSFGCLLWHLFVGTGHPYVDDRDMSGLILKLGAMAKDSKQPTEEELRIRLIEKIGEDSLKKIDPDGRIFKCMYACLQIDPTKRCSMSDVMEVI